MDNVLAPEQCSFRVNQDITPQSNGEFLGVKKIIVEPFCEEYQVKQEFGRKDPRKRPRKQATINIHLESGFGSPDDCSVISLGLPRIKQQCLE